MFHERERERGGGVREARIIMSEEEQKKKNTYIIIQLTANIIKNEYYNKNMKNNFTLSDYITSRWQEKINSVIKAWTEPISEDSSTKIIICVELYPTF